MQTHFYLLCFCLFFLTPAYARLGETMAQCEARYGAHLRVEEGDKKDDLHRQYVYEKNGYCLKICYLHGVAADIDIERDDQAALTDAEVKTLLDSNSGGLPWKEASDDNAPIPGVVGSQWIRSDGAHAYSLGGIVFILKQYDDAVAAQRAKDDATALKSF